MELNSNNKPRKPNLVEEELKKLARRKAEADAAKQAVAFPPDPPPPPPLFGESSAELLRRVLAEQVRRRTESLNLYRPLPLQANFHASAAPERIIRGSNRSGKTLSAAVEVARAVTGQDPFKKFPKTDGIAYLVGKDGREVGQVMWRKLGRPGAFRIIRDLTTNAWRVYQQNDPGDVARVAESRPAPPLIPHRFIKEISWENKKDNLPKIVRLTTGWELHFFSSLGKPPHGADIDLAWLDEEIIDRDWYPEIGARLVDRAGRFIWSATPQAGTEQLWALSEKAEAESALPAKKVEEFKLLITENAHITPEQVKDFASKLGEDEYAVRIMGEFALLAFKVFPEFQKVVHLVDWFEIPQTWTRYLAIDPGRQICAVLFLAIPPPERGDVAYVYDELYIPNCDAELFGDRMKVKTQGQQFESFIIDHQEGRKVEAGGGRSIEDMYSDALRKRGVSSETTGCGFLWGDANPKAGVEAARLWLRDREDGTCKLRVVKDKCPNFIWEIEHYRYKRVNGILTDSPEERGRVHLQACWRYLVQARPKYVEAKKGTPYNPVVAALKRKRERQNKDRPSVFLGPGGSGA